MLIAAATSPSWEVLERDSTARPQLTRGAGVLVALLAVQLGLGLDLRHLVAASGRNLLSVATFYAHIGVGLCIAAAAFWVLAASTREAADTPCRALLARPAVIIVLLVVSQLVLGFATFMVTSHTSFDREPSALEGWVPTIHVGVGALLLAASSLLLVRAKAAQPTSVKSTGAHHWALS